MFKSLGTSQIIIH